MTARTYLIFIGFKRAQLFTTRLSRTRIVFVEIIICRIRHHRTRSPHNILHVRIYLLFVCSTYKHEFNCPRWWMSRKWETEQQKNEKNRMSSGFLGGDYGLAETTSYTYLLVVCWCCWTTSCMYPVKIEGEFLYTHRSMNCRHATGDE